MAAISPFALNAVVILTITRDGRTFRTKAKVVDSLHATGMGLMFTAREPEQVRVLEFCLNEGTSGTLVEPVARARGAHFRGAGRDRLRRRPGAA